MPSHYVYVCDSCGWSGRRYRNLKNCPKCHDLARRDLGLVALEVDGVIDTHLPHHTSNYATLCGIAADDPTLAQYPAMAQRSRVTCHDCRAMWEVCRRYGAEILRS